MTMRKNGVVLPELFAQGMKRFFWLPIARDKSERPISDLLFAGVPFVGPGKENGASESTFDHAIDMPAQHFGLLILAVSDCVHSEFAQDERTLFDEVLREQKFCRRISGVGK